MNWLTRLLGGPEPEPRPWLRPAPTVDEQTALRPVDTDTVTRPVTGNCAVTGHMYDPDGPPTCIYCGQGSAS